MEEVVWILADSRGMQICPESDSLLKAVWNGAGIAHCGPKNIKSRGKEFIYPGDMAPGAFCTPGGEAILLTDYNTGTIQKLPTWS